MNLLKRSSRPLPITQLDLYLKQKTGTFKIPASWINCFPYATYVMCSCILPSRDSLFSLNNADIIYIHVSPPLLAAGSSLFVGWAPASLALRPALRRRRHGPGKGRRQGKGAIFSPHEHFSCMVDS